MEGNENAVPVESKNDLPEKKSNNGIIGILLAAIMTIILGVLIVSPKESKMQEQIDLGNKYLEEMNYDEAIVTFMAVIEIEPKNVDAYLGLVEVYIRTGDFNTALEYSQKGYDMTGENRLKEKIEMIKSRNIVDSKGREISDAYYDGNNNLHSYIVYEYGKNSRREYIYLYSADGKLWDKGEIEYDEKGKTLKDVSICLPGDTMLPDSKLCKKEYKYDESGREIEVITWWPDGSIVKSEKEYDSAGNLLKETSYQDGSYRNSTEYQYDKNGNKIKQINYSCYYEGIASSTIWEYDSNGELLKSISYDSGENIISYTDWIDGGRSGFYSYDASGALDQSCEYINGKRVEKHYENGELTSTWEY